jgi:hypothetical protein
MAISGPAEGVSRYPLRSGERERVASRPAHRAVRHPRALRVGTGLFDPVAGGCRRRHRRPTVQALGDVGKLHLCGTLEKAEPNSYA